MYDRDQYLADLEAKRWCQFVPKHERPVLGRLIKLCLEGGNTISVFDSEEYVVKRGTEYSLIKSRLGHAEEDLLIIRNAAGDKLGWFNLIYNNGSEEDPCIVIADYAAGDFCRAIFTQLLDQYGE